MRPPASLPLLSLLINLWMIAGVCQTPGRSASGTPLYCSEHVVQGSQELVTTANVDLLFDSS